MNNDRGEPSAAGRGQAGTRIKKIILAIAMALVVIWVIFLIRMLG